MDRVRSFFTMQRSPSFLCLVSASFAQQEEEQVFSNDEDPVVSAASDGSRVPSHPATAYWKVTATMTLTAAAQGTHVQMLLPLSDGRQSVLARRASADGVNYREEADGLNLWGHWTVTDAGAAMRHITYEYTVQIADSRTELPVVSFPLK